jgi:NitT/TauT family transport system substrate-binding protein
MGIGHGPQGRLPPRRLVALVVVAALLTGACGRGGEGAGLEDVRIGANLWMGYDLLSMAADLGWFAEEGFDVEVIDLGSLGDTKAAFERGYVDGMATTVFEVVQVGSESDLKPVVVLAIDYSDGGDVVVARRGIASTTGLAGARIVVEPPLGIYMLYRMLAKAGMTLGDVQVVWASQPDIEGLAWSGQIDAAVSYPPVSTELTHQLGYNTLFSSAEIPGEVLDVVSFSEQFTRDHPGAVRATVRVWDRALRYLSEEHQAAVAAIAAREGLSAAEVEEALAGVRFLSIEDQGGPFLDQNVAATCSRAAELLLEVGVITETYTAAGCVSSEFVLDVIKAMP